VIGGALALGLGAAALLPFARFDDDPLNLRDPAAESMTTLFELFDDPRVTPYAAAVLAPSLEAGAALAVRLEALPEVASARALSDLVPADQDHKLAMIDEMAVFLGPLFQGSRARPAPSPDESWAALDGLREALGLTEGAHAPAARRLADALRDYFGAERVTFVVGALSDKDVRGLAEELAPLATIVFAARSAHPRSLEPAEIAAVFGERGARAEHVDSVANALEKAMAASGSDAVICLTGSLFVAAEGRAHLGKAAV
jgi:hypothetical protein